MQQKLPVDKKALMMTTAKACSCGGKVMLIQKDNIAGMMFRDGSKKVWQAVCQGCEKRSVVADTKPMVVAKWNAGVFAL